MFSFCVIEVYLFIIYYQKTKKERGRKGRQYNNAVELDIAVCFCFHIIYVLGIYYSSQCVYRYYISFFSSWDATWKLTVWNNQRVCLVCQWHPR